MQCLVSWRLCASRENYSKYDRRLVCPCCIKKNPKLKILYKGRSEVEFSSSAKVSSVPKSSARVSPVAVGPASQVICKQITKLTLFTALLEWKIEEFKTLMELSEIGQSINSHPFFCPQAKTHIYQLQVYPNGRNSVVKETTANARARPAQKTVEQKAREDVYFMLVPMHKSDQSRTRVHINLINSKGNGFLIGESGNCKQAEVTKNLQEDESVVISCSVKFLGPTKTLVDLGD
uniref:Uncharacterized protein n=1 Tax=Ditylenchus dipsaci TaxID=166011 RepID=A0A915DN36_9BILA